MGCYMCDDLDGLLLGDHSMGAIFAGNRRHIAYCVFKLNLTQIGEAIHSSSDDHAGGDSIRLADARGNEQDERTRFLDNHDENRHSEDSDEERPRLGSRRSSAGAGGIMGNHAAARSVVDVDGLGTRQDDDAESLASHASRSAETDLSSKAGIILVR
jgi:hypothetical protein